MKVFFLGTPAFAVPSLEVLAGLDFAEIKTVITHPDKPKGRNLVVIPPPVRISAQKLNLPVCQPERVSSPEFTKKIKDIECDLMIVVSFGEILSNAVLKIPKTGCINLHSSLLPKYRGAAPVARALMNGEKETGVTTFWISEKMDSGDIIMQKRLEILPEDTRGTLEEKLSFLGADLLKETLVKIQEGKAEGYPQDEKQATYAPKIKKEDGLIDWTKSALEIYNKIRAMNPWPVAFTNIDKKRIEVWTSEVIDKKITGVKPGTVVSLDSSGISISTGNGLLLLKELQAEGKRRIKAIDFAHGYRIKEGKIFGV